MVRTRSEMTKDVKENLRGGKGALEFLNYFSEKEMNHCRLFAEITLPPGGSIGEHPHQNEAEYFIVLKGSATTIENGKEYPMGPGDYSITTDGNSHSLINSGTGPLVVLAVIIVY